MTPEEKLESLGIELPEAAKPLGSYVPFVRTGNLIYLSGMLPMRNGKLAYTGRAGEDVSLEDAADAARICAINGLAVLRSALGGLGRVKNCVRIEGYVSSAENFIDQPKVMNGASDFMSEVFGEAGRHSRIAVGVNILPLNSPVEVAFVFEVEA
jgi:enamine deaminase RidA (YjgF/YER057c/UK114 family)